VKGYTVEGNGIRTGLIAAEGIANEVIDKILAARESGGVFASQEDFRTRVDGVSERGLESLVKSGAFDAV